MSAARAVEIIQRGLQRDGAVVAFPLLLALATRFTGRVPERLRRWILGRFRFTVSSAL